jgi:hypothetical protein
MSFWRHLLTATFLILVFGASAKAEVVLTISDGRVSLVAKDATLADILNEWARVGRVEIRDISYLPKERLTLQLSDIPEGRALDIVLRSAGGYIAVARSGASAASQFSSIFVFRSNTYRSRELNLEVDRTIEQHDSGTDPSDSAISGGFAQNLDDLDELERGFEAFQAAELRRLTDTNSTRRSRAPVVGVPVPGMLVPFDPGN